MKLEKKTYFEPAPLPNKKMTQHDLKISQPQIYLQKLIHLTVDYHQNNKQK